MIGDAHTSMVALDPPGDTWAPGCRSRWNQPSRVGLVPSANPDEEGRSDPARRGDHRRRRGRGVPPPSNTPHYRYFNEFAGRHAEESSAPDDSRPTATASTTRRPQTRCRTPRIDVDLHLAMYEFDDRRARVGTAEETPGVRIVRNPGRETGKGRCATATRPWSARRPGLAAQIHVFDHGRVPA